MSESAAQGQRECVVCGQPLTPESKCPRPQETACTITDEGPEASTAATNTTSPVAVLRNFIYDDSRGVPAGVAEIEAQAEAEAALDAVLWEAKATRAALAQVLGWGDFRACSSAQTEEFAAWAKQVGLAHLGQPHIREDLFA